MDGANKIDDLVKSVKQDKQIALALTDHGNMHGALEHYNTCKKYDIKPIVGNELYIAQESRFIKHSGTNKYNHLTLLAENNIGYKNLLILTSLSYIEGLSYRPRIDLELLQKYSKGIICLSGCLSGRVNQLFTQDRNAEAELAADNLIQIFGRSNFWFELQRNGLGIQDKANEALIKLAAKMEMPLVATNDIHYHRKEDCSFQDTLLCINTGSKKKDQDRFKFETDTLYFKTAKEMDYEFRDLRDSIKETVSIADRVDINIEQGKFLFPETTYKDPELELQDNCKKALKIKYPNCNQKVQDRVNYELGVIKSMGFSEYFLIVRDMIEWAKSKSIPVGPGRGSVAGSIVAYLLNITQVDPIKYNLLFERFLNSARIKTLPDIDIDFCKDRRKEVIDYLKDKYGYDKVASIITFGTFAPKAAIKAVGRALDIPLQDTANISDKCTEESIKESINKDKSLEKLEKKYPELFETAKQLEGMCQFAGTHASGVVVSDRPLYEILPLSRQKDGTITTQWDLNDCEKLGLVKFDLLGLETLTIIKQTLDLIKDNNKKTPKSIDNIELDDPKIYSILQKGDTEGIFQCYSEGMRKLLSEIKPSCFNDIVAALALYRPGPIDSGLYESFIKRKSGEEAITYIHDDLESILGHTYGVMVYQEQIMKISTVLAGFSLNQADEVRKAIGKKLPELIKEIKNKFLSGCKTVNKITEEQATLLWDQIALYGRYGFNESHSVSYALLTYYTAYLKAYYLPEFLTANLTAEMDNPDKCQRFIKDVKLHGIKLLPPSIKNPKWNFSIEKDSIRMGIGMIKGLGENVRNEIINLTPKETLVDMLRQLPREKLRRNIYANMVKAGLFDCFNLDRAMLIEHAESVLYLIHPDRTTTKKNKSLKSAGDLYNITNYTKWSDRQKLIHEGEVYHTYISGHPFEFEKANRLAANLRTIEYTTDNHNPKEIKIAGIITDVTIKSIKSGKNKGKKYARIFLEDETKNAICTIFADSYEKYQQLIDDALTNNTPVVLIGKPENISGTLQMIVMKVKLLSDLAQKNDTIILDVSNKLDIDNFINILKQFPGDKKVYLNYKNNIIRTNHSIQPTLDLVAKLEIHRNT